MLSTSNPIKAGSSRDYYREMERGEYYTGNGQSPGQWFGPGAKALGLADKVTSDVLSNLFEGRSPDGERNLVQNAGHPNRQMGWDHTFSAPKPMSTFYAVCPEYRDLCEQIQTAGVRVAASYLSDVAGKSRQGKGGKDRVDAKLVFAMFLETVSRELDPQIHTHALVLNVGVRADGTTGALWSRELFVEKMAAGAIYRAQLAFDLRRLLGVEIKARRVGFDIVGVPAELSREFSKRRQAIEAMLEEWKDDSAVAAKVATLVTRHAKWMLPTHELDARWQATASKHQWTAENARTLVGKTPWRQTSAKDLAEAVPSEASRLPDHLRNRKHVVRLAGRLAIELNADGAALRGLFETKLPEMLRTLNSRRASQTRQEQSRPQAKQHPEEGVGNRSADRAKRLAFWLGREAGLKPDVIERAIGDLVPKDGWTLFRVESRQLFPKAPSLALRKLRTRRLVLFNPPRYWGKVRWTMNLLVCELRAGQVSRSAFTRLESLPQLACSGVANHVGKGQTSAAQAVATSRCQA